MNDQAGYVLLHRKIFESKDFNNLLEVSVFIYLLCKASHKVTEVVYRRKKILLSRGEVCIAYRDLAKKFGVTVKKIRTIIKNFERAQNLALRRHKTINVYLIVKYEKYQSNDVPKGSKRAQERADRTNNYINNINNTSTTSIGNKYNKVIDMKKVIINKSSIPTLQSLNKVIKKDDDELTRILKEKGRAAYEEYIKKNTC